MAANPVWTALCIYDGEDGRSRLIDLDIPVTHKATAPDGSAHWVGVAGATRWGLAGDGSSPDHHAWHNSTHAGLSITLRGRWEIEAGDGTRRALGPGDMLVMLDTTGQGHRSWKIEEGASMVVGVGLDADAERDMRARLAARLAGCGSP